MSGISATRRGSGRRGRAAARRPRRARRRPPGARRRRASAAGTFSKPADPLVDPVVVGERVAPAAPLADQQHADPGRAAPLVRASRPRPTSLSGSGQPAHGGAGVHEQRDVAAPRRPRPTGWTVPTSWLARWRRHDAGLARGRRARSGRPGRAGPRGTAGTRRSVRHASGVQHRGVLDRAVRRPRARRAAGSRPSSPRCTASVPEEVKETSSRRTPSASATASRALSRTSRASRAGAVQAPRVGVPPVERGQHRLAGRRVQRLGGRGVEVHAAKLPDGDPPTRRSLSLRLVLGSAVSEVVGPRGALPWVCSPRVRAWARPALRRRSCFWRAGASDEGRGAWRCPTRRPSRASTCSTCGRALDRRPGHRRRGLGPDLLRRDPLPAAQRRRDPRADPLQPAARDLLHDRAGRDGGRVLQPHGPDPEHRPRGRDAARQHHRGHRPAVVLDVQLRHRRHRPLRRRRPVRRPLRLRLRPRRRHRLLHPHAVAAGRRDHAVQPAQSPMSSTTSASPASS